MTLPLCLPFLVCVLGMAGRANAATTIPNERVTTIARWLPEKPAGSDSPISDRACWNARLKQSAWQQVLAKARSLTNQPVPELPDDLFLDFSRTGNRTRCQKVLSQRDDRLETLTLAECLENQGKFIPALCDIIDALCAERTWVMPAHDRKLECFKGKKMDMDLRATLVGWDLATANYLLGDALPAPARAKIEREVNRRILLPFREIVEGRAAGAYWLKATHNWNAVCLAGVVGSALPLVKDAQDRAWYVAAAEHYINNFLRSFTPDGYCSEGMGYWNYGYGRFLMLAEMVRSATQGNLDLLAAPAAAPPALYALRAEILNGLYPSIADCSPSARPDSTYVKYIAGRFGLDRPEIKSADFSLPIGSLGPGRVFNGIKEPLPALTPPDIQLPETLRTWFSDGGVLICRPGATGSPFAAVLKAGHNAENHNHNDIGSFSVVAGRSMVLCDPGGEVYTARTFSSRRYESKLLNSFGHAVPMLDGKLQRTGIQARAAVLKTQFSSSQDVLLLDLKSGYEVPDLKRLEREFQFLRGAAPALIVTDHVAFLSPRLFESALITWGTWQETTPGTLRIADGKDAVNVSIDAGGHPFKVSSELLDEDVGGGRKPTRIAIKLTEPIAEGRVILRITPVK